MRNFRVASCFLFVNLLLAACSPLAHARASHSHSHAHHSSHTVHHHRAYCSTCKRDRHGHIQRSRKAREAFEHSRPCPATGKTRGRCPGYVVDHKIALECGGADTPSNMQWQTKAAALAKDRTESGCAQ